MIDKIAELYSGKNQQLQQHQQSQQSQKAAEWWQDRFVRKVIIFICVMLAVGTVVTIALLFADYQQTKEAITQMQRIRF